MNNTCFHTETSRAGLSSMSLSPYTKYTHNLDSLSNPTVQRTQIIAARMTSLPTLESEFSDSEEEREPVYPSDLATVIAALDGLYCTPPTSPRRENHRCSDPSFSDSSSSPDSSTTSRRQPSSRHQPSYSSDRVVEEFESTKKARTFSPYVTPVSNVREEKTASPSSQVVAKRSMRKSVKRMLDFGKEKVFKK